LNSSKNKVFLAGGVDISVFLSYLDFINSSGTYSGDVFLFYITKRKLESNENVYCNNIPNFVSVRSFITDAGESGHTGRFTIEDLMGTISDLKEKEYFICGPPKYSSYWEVTIQSGVPLFYADAALWTKRPLYHDYIILI
jgi:predicted ferric reductase